MSLSKWLAKFHGERIDALKAVREAIGKLKQSRSDPDRFLNHNKFETGSTAFVLPIDKTVTKFTSPATEEAKKEFKRRGFLDSVLHDQGLAPKTHLIETKNNKYMVQPKADKVLNYSTDYRTRFDGTLIDEWMYNKVNDAGLTAKDVFGKNVGVFDGKPKLIDSGLEKMIRPMTPAERESALSKFISYGKRPSLEKWIKKNEGK